MPPPEPPLHTSAYDPRLYALTHTGNDGDADFYAARCAGAGGILELGCGFGRLIPPLSRPDCRYVGLDLNRDLLRTASKALSQPQDWLVQADMAHFAFATKFDRILLPYSTLYCLQDRPSVRSCLLCIREHLSDGGQLIFDVYNADPFHYNSEPDDQADDHEDWIADLNLDGNAVTVFERSRWNRSRQELHASYRYASESQLERWGHITHRYLLRNELVDHLDEAGLTVETAFGDFGEAPFDPDGDHLIIVASAK